MNEEIEADEWKDYFMTLLGGIEKNIMKGRERREKRNSKRGEKLEKEKVRRVIGKLRDGKAAGIDGRPGEV